MSERDPTAHCPLLTVDCSLLTVDVSGSCLPPSRRAASGRSIPPPRPAPAPPARPRKLYPAPPLRRRTAAGPRATLTTPGPQAAVGGAASERWGGIDLPEAAR